MYPGGGISVSPIQIVWGFPPYVLYGQRSAYFQKWTGGGNSTLMRKNVPFDISHRFPEAISEKTFRKKVTAKLPEEHKL